MTSRLFAVVLEKMGNCEVAEENLPGAALATAKRFLPDVILLDIRMPGKDGHAISAELARVPELARTSVVFVTGSIAGFEGGFRDGQQYLAKPVDVQTLLETVATLYSKQEPLSHAA